MTQQERIELYKSNVVDSDSEDDEKEEVKEGNRSLDQDDDNDESDFDDHDEDLTGFQNYACLDDEEEEEEEEINKNIDTVSSVVKTATAKFNDNRKENLDHFANFEEMVKEEKFADFKELESRQPNSQQQETNEFAQCRFLESNCKPAIVDQTLESSSIPQGNEKVVSDDQHHDSENLNLAAENEKTSNHEDTNSSTATMELPVTFEESFPNNLDANDEDNEDDTGLNTSVVTHETDSTTGSDFYFSRSNTDLRLPNEIGDIAVHDVVTIPPPPPPPSPIKQKNEFQENSLLRLPPTVMDPIGRKVKSKQPCPLLPPSIQKKKIATKLTMPPPPPPPPASKPHTKNTNSPIKDDKIIPTSNFDRSVDSTVEFPVEQDTNISLENDNCLATLPPTTHSIPTVDKVNAERSTFNKGPKTPEDNEPSTLDVTSATNEMTFPTPNMENKHVKNLSEAIRPNLNEERIVVIDKSGDKDESKHSIFKEDAAIPQDKPPSAPAADESDNNRQQIKKDDCMCENGDESMNDVAILSKIDRSSEGERIGGNGQPLPRAEILLENNCNMVDGNVASKLELEMKGIDIDVDIDIEEDDGKPSETLEVEMESNLDSLQSNDSVSFLEIKNVTASNNIDSPSFDPVETERMSVFDEDDNIVTMQQEVHEIKHDESSLCFDHSANALSINPDEINGAQTADNPDQNRQVCFDITGVVDPLEEGYMTPAVSKKERKEMCSTTRRNNKSVKPTSLEMLKHCSATLSSIYYVPPEESPSPLETTLWRAPNILIVILSCLGDPAVVCRMKSVNCFCNRIIAANEYMIMKNAVRIGGIDNHMRPKFWLWVTLEKCQNYSEQSFENVSVPGMDRDTDKITMEETTLDDFNELEKRGRESKWHHIIERDVPRAFGNMPPHKAKSHLRSKSIVRALITWGGDQFVLKRCGDGTPRILNSRSNTESEKAKPIRQLSIPSPSPKFSFQDDSTASDANLNRADTVSDWSGISPVNSFSSAQNGQKGDSRSSYKSKDMAVSSRGISSELKVQLQMRLESILDAIAGAHEGVGYCQGMDYIVAHLLRILQDTVELNAKNGTLPKVVQSANRTLSSLLNEADVVEEAVFRVMHTLLTTYSLQHMYWPELRCLKTCCRIFERIVEQKLPVLADHFDYHDLHIGMFALGWFQTLFLYIPSMPAPTVNQIWDIWFVERSMKIFFRVATAILFLCQPILLNHDLEGMMQYLNTFPDSTIFSPDILINCGLGIKLTNQMLEDIEISVVQAHEVASGIY